MADADIILNIDPPVWNAIKFLALAVVATPLLELLLHRVIDSKATYDVLNGKQISLRESKLSIFSLHSSYWGPSWNKAFLLLIALPILAADLLVEFSFSATAIDVSERTQVWLQPPHLTRYANASRREWFYLSNTTTVDPCQFTPETAPLCIEGPNILSKNIVNNTSTDTDDYISGFEYRLNGTYVIRNSYLTSDNKTTVCSASKTVGDVNFVFPYVSQVRGTTKGEGVNPRENNTDSQFRAVFTQTPLQYIGKVVLPGGTVEFWTNDNVTCLAIGRTTFVCGAMVGARFVLANTNGFDPDLILWSSSRPLTNVTVAEIVSASGEPINGMKSSERRIRLLASLIGSRVLSTYRFGDKPSQRLITKDTLERISFMIMSVANEEGIGGMREEKGFRSIKKAEKQSATMKRMAYIPIGILLFSAVALAAVDRLISLLITLKLRNDGFKRASTREVHERTRVQMSMQWFSERVCDDLRASTIFQDVSLSDVSAKHVVDGGEQWFQVLPLRSGQHQYGNAP